MLELALPCSHPAQTVSGGVTVGPSGAGRLSTLGKSCRPEAGQKPRRRAGRRSAGDSSGSTVTVEATNPWGEGVRSAGGRRLEGRPAAWLSASRFRRLHTPPAAKRRPPPRQIAHVLAPATTGNRTPGQQHQRHQNHQPGGARAVYRTAGVPSRLSNPIMAHQPMPYRITPKTTAQARASSDRRRHRPHEQQSVHGNRRSTVSSSAIASARNTRTQCDSRARRSALSIRDPSSPSLVTHRPF